MSADDSLFCSSRSSSPMPTARVTGNGKSSSAPEPKRQRLDGSTHDWRGNEGQEHRSIERQGHFLDLTLGDDEASPGYVTTQHQSQYSSHLNDGNVEQDQRREPRVPTAYSSVTKQWSDKAPTYQQGQQAVYSTSSQRVQEGTQTDTSTKARNPSRRQKKGGQSIHDYISTYGDKLHEHVPRLPAKRPFEMEDSDEEEGVPKVTQPAVERVHPQQDANNRAASTINSTSGGNATPTIGAKATATIAQPVAESPRGLQPEGVSATPKPPISRPRPRPHTFAAFTSSLKPPTVRDPAPSTSRLADTRSTKPAAEAGAPPKKSVSFKEPLKATQSSLPTPVPGKQAAVNTTQSAATNSGQLASRTKDDNPVRPGTLSAGDKGNEQLVSKTSRSVLKKPLGPPARQTETTKAPNKASSASKIDQQVAYTSAFQSALALVQPDSSKTSGASQLPSQGNLKKPGSTVPHLTVPNEAAATTPATRDDDPAKPNDAAGTDTSVKDTLAVFSAARQQRIESMKERNRRLREIDDQAQAQEDAEEQANTIEAYATSNHSKASNPTLPSPATPSGPFALNSPAGIEAVRRKDTSERKKHSRKLGRITALDLELVDMKHLGQSWSSILEVYAQRTGLIRAQETLRKRHVQVSAALQSKGVTNKLKQDVINGVSGAEDELNALVTDDLPDGDTQTKHTSSLSRTKEKQLQNAVKDKPPTVKTTRPDSPLIEEDPTERPTTGGKKPSWALYRILMQPDNEEEQEVLSADDESVVSQDTIDPHGYMHFEYQVQRRECSSLQNLADGSTIDEALWHDVDDPHLDLVNANVAAGGVALLMRVGSDPIVTGLNFNINHMTDEDGSAHCQYESELGVIQTRVLQRARTLRDRIPVANKEGWLPRTLYHIKQRITKRTEDSLFEEGVVTEVQETFVDECTSADIAWANKKAIDKFVDLTYVTKSANLNLRDVEKTDLRRKLHEELDDQGDGAMFHGSKDSSQTLREVWVERGRLIGPRNL